MTKELDHKYTSEIVCPYCGYEFSDSWEFEDEDLGLMKCQECDKTFGVSRDVEVTYSTTRYGTCEKCGEEDVYLSEAPYIFDGYVCKKCWREDYDKFKVGDEE